MNPFLNKQLQSKWMVLISTFKCVPFLRKFEFVFVHCNKMATIQQKRQLNTKCLQEKYKALKLVEKVISKAEVARKVFLNVTIKMITF